MAKKNKASTSAKRQATRNEKTTAMIAKKLPLQWHVSPDQRAVFANHAVVRCDATMFQIYFFEAALPIALNDAQMEGMLTAMDHVDAHCVSRVVIPQDVMPGLIRALQLNQEKQQALAATIKEDADTHTASEEGNDNGR